MIYSQSSRTKKITESKKNFHKNKCRGITPNLTHTGFDYWEKRNYILLSKSQSIFSLIKLDLPIIELFFLEFQLFLIFKIKQNETAKNEFC